MILPHTKVSSTFPTPSPFSSEFLLLWKQQMSCLHFLTAHLEAACLHFACSRFFVCLCVCVGGGGWGVRCGCVCGVCVCACMCVCLHVCDGENRETDGGAEERGRSDLSPGLLQQLQVLPGGIFQQMSPAPCGSLWSALGWSVTKRRHVKRIKHLSPKQFPVRFLCVSKCFNFVLTDLNVATTSALAHL